MTQNTLLPLKFVFFGTSNLSVIVLDELEQAGFVPRAIICPEDKPVGRKMTITPPATKIWAEKRNIQVFQPTSLRESKNPGVIEKIKNLVPQCQLFIVASYGNLIPQEILNIPIHGTLNVHPSLLPKLRGPSPIQSAILSENETGVSIILLDAEMDHGPLLAQEKTMSWNGFGALKSIDESDLPYADELENTLAHEGGKMLAEIIPIWIDGKITPKEQDHSIATICQKITKEDGLLAMSDSAEKNIRKIRAFRGWPTAYFFAEKDGKKMRIIVTRARIENGELIIERVIPEGKKEMDYADFERGMR